MLNDVFSPDDILKDWKWKGKELPPETIEKLKAEAEAFQGSLLWQVLSAEVKWWGVKNLMEKGKDEDDIRFANLLHNVVDVINAKLKGMVK